MIAFLLAGVAFGAVGAVWSEIIFRVVVWTHLTVTRRMERTPGLRRLTYRGSGEEAAELALLGLVIRS